VDLKLVEDAYFETWPVNRNLSRLSDISAVDNELAVGLGILDSLLTLNNLRVIIRTGLLDKIEKNVVSTLSFVHLEVIQSLGFERLLPQLVDVLPQVVDLLGIFANLISLKVKITLDVLLHVLKELNVFRAIFRIFILLVVDLFLDVFEAVQVEWNESKANSSVVVLAQPLEFQHHGVFVRAQAGHLLEEDLAHNNVDAIVLLLKGVHSVRDDGVVLHGLEGITHFEAKISWTSELIGKHVAMHLQFTI
jgi:hypothetical protein